LVIVVYLFVAFGESCASADRRQPVRIDRNGRLQNIGVKKSRDKSRCSACVHYNGCALSLSLLLMNEELSHPRLDVIVPDCCRRRSMAGHSFTLLISKVRGSCFLYLIDDCCGGKHDVCEPLIESMIWECCTN
jgi:hypothetical protein